MDIVIRKPNFNRNLRSLTSHGFHGNSMVNIFEQNKNMVFENFCTNKINTENLVTIAQEMLKLCFFFSVCLLLIKTYFGAIWGPFTPMQLVQTTVLTNIGPVSAFKYSYLEKYWC